MDAFSTEEKERVFDMIECIEQWQGEYDVWGHGTYSTDVATKISKEGLETNFSSPYEFAYKLSEHREQLIKQLCFWDYNALEHIVIMLLKKDLNASGTDGQRLASEREAKDFVFDTQGDGSGVFGQKNRISSEKIVGHWDITQKTFHPS